MNIMSERKEPPMIDYESLSNDELTILLSKKYPQKFFRVTNENRHMAVAFIKVAFQGDPDS